MYEPLYTNYSFVAEVITSRRRLYQNKEVTKLITRKNYYTAFLMCSEYLHLKFLIQGQSALSSLLCFLNYS